MSNATLLLDEGGIACRAAKPITHWDVIATIQLTGSGQELSNLTRIDLVTFRGMLRQQPRVGSDASATLAQHVLSMPAQ